MKTPEHTTWIEISRSDLTHNIRALRGLLAPDTVLAATVKANAYGHGAVETGQIFLEAGADWLSVHSVDEALELRAGGVTAPVYVLGYVPTARLDDVVKHNLDVVVYDRARLEVLGEVAKKLQTTTRVHLKLETGLHRQGVEESELIKLAEYVADNPFLELMGITSHFANIEDTTSPDFAKAQYAAFEAALGRLAEKGITSQYRHMANSAATMLHPDMHGNFVRPGIACYGIWPSGTTRDTVLAERSDIELRPAFTWKAIVAQIKTLAPGDSVGYGRTYVADHPVTMAIIPVGYYEGFDRRAGSEGYVLIGGQRAPVVGRVSMNNIMVDCTGCGNVAPEDEVVLVGRQGDLEITAEEVAGWTDRIPYEVPTRIGVTLSGRIPRIIVD